MKVKDSMSSPALWFQQGIRIFWLIGIALILFTDKFDFHKKINSFHSPLLDFSFRYLTHLGDGLFAVILGLIIVIKNVRFGILIFVSYIGSALFTQLLKQVIFPHFNRPYFFFKNDSTFHFIENFNYHSHHSFPSGHATSCFAIFTILAYYFSSKITSQILFIILAIIVGLSRVYLSQHFFQDVVAGSMIGYFFAHFTWVFLHSNLEKFNAPIGSVWGSFKK